MPHCCRRIPRSRIPRSNQEFHLSLTRRQLFMAGATLRLVGAGAAAAGLAAGRRARPRRTTRPSRGRSGRRRPQRRHGARLRQGAGDHHRICLDDLPALRAFLGDDLPRAAKALHRHRQGALHVPRIPARSARGGRIHARALRRQGQIHADRGDAVRQAGRLGRREAGPAARGRSPSSSASPKTSSINAWRIRRCSTASRRCATTPSRSSGSIPRRLSSSTARSSSATSRSTNWPRKSTPISRQDKGFLPSPRSPVRPLRGRRTGAATTAKVWIILRRLLRLESRQFILRADAAPSPRQRAKPRRRERLMIPFAAAAQETDIPSE